MTPLVPGGLFRAIGRAVALVAVGAAAASAQIRPPNIQGPINAAKKVANKTSDEIRAEQNTGKEGKVGDAVLPAQAAKDAQAAAQKAASQKTAPPKGAPQKGAAPAPQKSGSTPQRGAAMRQDSGSASQAGRVRGAVTVYREAFTYDAAGRRDPFVSLMLSGELRPIITDLVLTGVFFDPQGRRSIAMLVDNSTGQNYGVRVGQTLGRMKVARIAQESITFDIDEFGLSRSETLIIDKSKTVAPRRP